MIKGRDSLHVYIMRLCARSWFVHFEAYPHQHSFLIYSLALPQDGE